MTLYYTPRSHFSRKVRILLDASAVDPPVLDPACRIGRTRFCLKPAKPSDAQSRKPTRPLGRQSNVRWIFG